MKDEEMAEEYFKSVCKDYNEEKERTGERHYWVGFDLKNAFLAGLNAGRPEWHDLRKDPNDLPKKEGEYLVCYETDGGNYRNTFILKYEEYDEGLHWCDDIFETFDEGVIAWCEVPHYTEE